MRARAFLGMVFVVLGLAAGLRAQTADDLYEGIHLEAGAVEGEFTLKWWGREGRTYFILTSETLFDWTYVPVIESGADEVIEWGFSTTASGFFVKLRHTDATYEGEPEDADFDGDGVGNMEELLDGTDPFNADTDGDGWTDHEEKQLGTDAQNVNSYPNSENYGSVALNSVRVEYEFAWAAEMVSTGGPGLDPSTQPPSTYWSNTRTWWLPSGEGHTQTNTATPQMPPLTPFPSTWQESNYYRAVWNDGLQNWFETLQYWDGQDGHASGRRLSRMEESSPSPTTTTHIKEWSVGWWQMRLKSNLRLPVDVEKPILIRKDIHGVDLEGNSTGQITSFEMRSLFLNEGQLEGSVVHFMPSPPEQTVENWRICPIEIVDRSGLPPMELAVAKMEDSLGPGGVLDIDEDPDRFYVRIPRLGNVQSVSIVLGTLSPDPDYSDGGTVIELEQVGPHWQTKSMLLVSDDVDDLLGDDEDAVTYGSDDELNDRTHKIQLGGHVWVTSLTVNGQTFSINLKAPVPVHRILPVRIRRMADSTATSESIEEDIRVTNERLAQIKIRLEPDFDSTPLPVPHPTYPGPISNTTLYSSGPGLHGVTYGVVTFMQIYGSDHTIDDVEVFYVKDTFKQEVPPVGVWGFAVIENSFSRTTNPYHPIQANTAFIDSNRGQFVLAHELVHILTRLGHYGSAETFLDYSPNAPAHKILHNLMKDGGTSINNTPEASKRIYLQQTTPPSILLRRP